MKVGIACGGTGGHIFPGLIVADELGRRGHAVSLWLSGREVESEVVRGRSEPVHFVRAAGLPATLGVRALFGAFRFAHSIFACRTQMRRDRPQVVLGMGGYASVGPCLAARSLGIPFVLHEGNAIPGRAVLFLSQFAAAVAVSFRSTGALLRKCTVEYTGFPIRSDLAGEFERGMLAEDLFTVLIMGGSQGAARLNEIAPQAICLLYQRGVKLQVVHLTGKGREASVGTRYAEVGVPHLVLGFLKEMGKAYHAADLAVARAGAASLMEMAACGVPAILVPYPHAVQDHQTRNAQEFEALGAAEILPESVLDAERLARRIENYICNRPQLDSMRKALENVAKPDAARRIADLLENVAQT